jgi:cellulose synthase/poly-beta-1,6-N-acetylglucosamine synthase-like glycosyltransferase
LDDSDGDTATWSNKPGLPVAAEGCCHQRVRRTSRDGYKAGGAAASVTAHGSHRAVFDADLIPPPDFLHATIPWFRNQGVGMVQTRWSFCNADHSWFTGIQSLLLGPHFSIEHRVRYRQGLFFNFNGTAGVWRRSAIESAGGWQSDRLPKTWI